MEGKKKTKNALPYYIKSTWKYLTNEQTQQDKAKSERKEKKKIKLYTEARQNVQGRSRK